MAYLSSSPLLSDQVAWATSLNIAKCVGAGLALWAAHRLVSGHVGSLPCCRSETADTAGARSPQPPEAEPRIPLVGNALHYKLDPPGFLLTQQAALGPVFTLDLAGFRTTLICDAKALRAFATAPSSVLSAQEAVSDFGFRHTLGDLNVFHGSRVHKSILVHQLYPLLTRAPRALREGMQEAVEATLGSSRRVDALVATRRILLRMTL